MSRKDIAAKLRKDPAQITRWLSSPTNLTLDTISDLLLACGAECEFSIVRLRIRLEASRICASDFCQTNNESSRKAPEGLHIHGLPHNVRRRH